MDTGREWQSSFNSQTPKGVQESLWTYGFKNGYRILKSYGQLLWNVSTLVEHLVWEEELLRLIGPHKTHRRIHLFELVQYLTEADATASLLTSSKQLELAIADENRKQQRLETAVSELAAAKIERDAADRALIAATAKRDDANKTNSGATKEQKAEAETEVTFRQGERARNQSAVIATEEKVSVRQTALDNAQRAREVIEDNQDTAITTASASTTSAARFSRPVSRNILDKDATIAIATSVENMVKEVLQKDYTLDSCMSVITSENIPKDDEAKEALKQSKKFCRDIVKTLLLVKSAEGADRIDIVNQELERIKIQTITKYKNDIETIFECIAPGGNLDIKKRDKLFDDENADDKLSANKSVVSAYSNVKQLRRYLVQSHAVRAAMAKAAASSTACTN